jgi:hypothetical protein
VLESLFITVKLIRLNLSMDLILLFYRLLEMGLMLHLMEIRFRLVLQDSLVLMQLGLKNRELLV